MAEVICILAVAFVTTVVLWRVEVSEARYWKGKASEWLALATRLGSAPSPGMELASLRAVKAGLETRLDSVSRERDEANKQLKGSQAALAEASDKATAESLARMTAEKDAGVMGEELRKARETLKAVRVENGRLRGVVVGVERMCAEACAEVWGQDSPGLWFTTDVPGRATWSVEIDGKPVEVREAKSESEPESDSPGKRFVGLGGDCFGMEVKEVGNAHS